MAYFKEEAKKYTSPKQILQSDINSVIKTGTIKSESVKADANGEKIVPVGSFIDKDGQVVTWEESAFSSTPIGITVRPIDVTYGDMPAAYYVEGWLIGERLNYGVKQESPIEYSNEIYDAIVAALPNIHLDPPDGYVASAKPGAAGSSVNFDLSKATGQLDLASKVTGTLGEENGGTGVTSIEEINLDTKYTKVDLSNVEGTLQIANGGTGATDKETAKSNLGIGDV